MTAPALSLRKGDFVTLLVGPDEEEFAVHESCITRNSDFFKAAMRKEWAEGQTCTIKLPEETCIESFANYLNFAYHEKLPTEEITIISNEGFKCTEVPYEVLGKIYVIGERMLDESVRNAVVREFIRLTTMKAPDESRRFPGESTITIIYDGTSTGSPMRRVMVDFYATLGIMTWPYKGQHPEFLEDLVEDLQRKIIGQKAIRDFRGRELVAEDYLV